MHADSIKVAKASGGQGMSKQAHLIEVKQNSNLGSN